MNKISLELLQWFSEELTKKIERLFVRKEEGKNLSENDYTTAEKEKLAGISDHANNYIHPESGAMPGTYRRVIIDAQGHVIAGSNPTTLSEYGITDAASSSHTHGDEDITSLDASKIIGDLSVEWEQVLNKPGTYPPSSHTHNLSQMDGFKEATDADIDAIIAGTYK